MDAEDGEDTPFRKTCRSRWAAMIKKVYEVDPLKCPKCGGHMRIISFIEKKDQMNVIEKITFAFLLVFPFICPDPSPPLRPERRGKEEFPLFSGISY